MHGFAFEDGNHREYTGGFAMYGSEYNNELAVSLGCEMNDEGAVRVDEEGRTSVVGVWAVGDSTPGNNQIPIALGDGAKVSLAIHRKLQKYPMVPDEPGTVEDESMAERAPPADD